MTGRARYAMQDQTEVASSTSTFCKLLPNQDLLGFFVFSFRVFLDKSCRQLGQLIAFLHQSSIHSLWNMWLQGVVLNSSPFRMSDRQTEQFPGWSESPNILQGIYLSMWLTSCASFRRFLDRQRRRMYMIGTPSSKSTMIETTVAKSVITRLLRIDCWATMYPIIYSEAGLEVESDNSSFLRLLLGSFSNLSPVP